VHKASALVRHIVSPTNVDMLRLQGYSSREPGLRAGLLVGDVLSGTAVYLRHGLKFTGGGLPYDTWSHPTPTSKLA